MRTSVITDRRMFCHGSEEWCVAKQENGDHGSGEWWSRSWRIGATDPAITSLETDALLNWLDKVMLTPKNAFRSNKDHGICFYHLSLEFNRR